MLLLILSNRELMYSFKGMSNGYLVKYNKYYMSSNNVNKGLRLWVPGMSKSSTIFCAHCYFILILL